MPVLLTRSLLLSLLAAMRLSAGADTPAVPNLLSEALPILQAGYVDLGALQVQPADQLGDLVRRSHGEIVLENPTSPAAAPLSIVSTLLPDGTVYCRLASFTPSGGWVELATQLKAWAAQGAKGLILDLRSTQAPDDFDGAADVAGLFLPPGLPLFTIKNAQQDSHAYVSANPAVGFNPPMINGPIAILMNEETAGAAEALAACLKANGALTLGRWTSGNGAEFADKTLSSGGKLRYVTGQVTMADGAPLWRHAVEPDIGLVVDPKKEETVLGLIAQNKVLEVIRESAGSHRLSEAALVRGEEPAVEAYLVPHDKAAAVTTPQDSALVAALDSLKAIRVSQETPAAAAAEPPMPSITQ